MFLAVHSSFFFANSAWTLPQKMPRIFFQWGSPFMQNIRCQTSREYSGNVLMSVPLYCLILPCGELDFSSHLSGNHAWELFFPKGEKSKHLSALARTCICREPRKQLQVRNWTVGWGKRRNPKYCLFYGPCCPSAVWVMEKAHECKAEQKLCLCLWSVNSLDTCSKLVPLLFHSCFIHCSSGAITMWIHLSSFHQ